MLVGFYFFFAAPESAVSVGTNGSSSSRSGKDKPGPRETQPQAQNTINHLDARAMMVPDYC